MVYDLSKIADLVIGMTGNAFILQVKILKKWAVALNTTGQNLKCILRKRMPFFC
jgi:hypothetical protein